VHSPLAGFHPTLIGRFCPTPEVEADPYTLSHMLCLGDAADHGRWTLWIKQSGSALTASFSEDRARQFRGSISNDKLLLTEPAGRVPNRKASCGEAGSLYLVARVEGRLRQRMLVGAVQMNGLSSSNQVNIKAYQAQPE
jgi:hypothetical protein